MLFAVYGSLRIGEFNYDFVTDTYGRESLVPIARGRIKGYHLYSLGAYPAAVKQEHAKGIVVEIMAANAEAAQFINGMERAAGYKPRVVRWGHHRLILYAQDHPEDHWHLISSGDWSKYLKARKEQIERYANNLQD